MNETTVVWFGITHADIFSRESHYDDHRCLIVYVMSFFEMNNVSILVLFYLKQFYIQAVTLATPLWLFHCPPNAPYHKDNTDYP